MAMEDCDDSDFLLLDRCGGRLLSSFIFRFVEVNIRLESIYVYV